MVAYYNENRKSAARILKRLVEEKLIPAGEVDDRSITDVAASDLIGFDQCHFFAGIGGWPLALRIAGWPDSRPVWTGSCPCQPFSSTAFKSTAQQDERHLWPDFDRLISECEPDEIFGEQVDEAVAAGWVDDAFHDLEEKGYACATIVLPALSVGASFEGQRLYFVASTAGDRQPGPRQSQQSIDNAARFFREADPLIHAFQGNALPYVCSQHDGIPTKLAREYLHGAGNAIVPLMAAEFIGAYLDEMEARS
jgi:DNA (cytosine-5)-methyltransferase 1